MARVVDAYRRDVDEELYPQLVEHGRTRVRIGEHRRDWSLDDEQRAEKIAIGYLGERAFQAWCADVGYDAQYLGEEVGSGPDEADFRAEDGRLLDVKTQEVLRSTPEDDWRCEVTQEQLTRPVDLYVFGKLLSNRSPRELWLVGWMAHDEFLEYAEHHERGSFLKGRRVRYPKWDVTIAQLHSMSELGRSPK